MQQLKKAVVSFFSILILFFFIIFYPFIHYRYLQHTENNKLVVGVSYDYQHESVDAIFSNLHRLAEIGVKVIRVPMLCDAYNLNSALNNKTECFYYFINSYRCFNVSVIVGFSTSEDAIKFYFERWGRYVSYIQILNEPELQRAWAEGAYNLDEEILQEFLRIKNIVDEYGLNAKYYTNFCPAIVLRANVLVALSRYLDFVGFDVYMDSFYYVTPKLVEFVRNLSGGKEIFITEFGSGDLDEERQADFLINCLELFKSMGIRQAWIWQWYWSGHPYSIRGKLAENRVAEWIAKQG